MHDSYANLLAGKKGSGKRLDLECSITSNQIFLQFLRVVVLLHPALLDHVRDTEDVVLKVQVRKVPFQEALPDLVIRPVIIEGPPPADLEQNGAQGEQVVLDCRVTGHVLHVRGRGVPHRGHDHAGRAVNTGAAKVGQDQVARVRDEDVVDPDVAVDYAPGVDVSDSLCYLERPTDHISMSEFGSKLFLDYVDKLTSATGRCTRDSWPGFPNGGTRTLVRGRRSSSQAFRPGIGV